MNLFQQGAFQIDPNSTPEMIKEKRARLAAMMPRYGQAKYVGEGLGQLFTGIGSGIQNRKMDAYQGDRSREASEQFNTAITGGGGPLSILGMNDVGLGQSQPITDAQRLGNDTMAALGKAPQGGYRESLIGTESGGNFAAQNNEMGSGGKRGHFGRVQFGQARLQDAMNAGAIPQGTTPEQFMASPQMQMAAENWHFNDLEQKLAPFVGTVVNGKPLDMGALVAMGHLGGAAGAKRYVESGGQYNPSDSFGTSLADYAQTHGGRGGAPQGQPSGGANMDALMQAAANPWLTPEQRSVVTNMIQQQQTQAQAADDRHWKQADPMYQAQLAQLTNPAPDKGTPDMQEYRFAQSQGFGGTFQDFIIGQKKAGATNVTTTVGGEPTTAADEAELRKKLGGKEGESWAAALDQGVTSAGTMQDMQLLDEIITMAPQGPIQGRLANAFPGMNSAADAFNSVVKRVAPTLRAPGSGSTSDIEYDGMLKSLPQLSSRPEANTAISAMMKAKSEINMERAQIVRDYQNEDISVKRARELMAGLDKRSIMTPELKALLGGLGPAPADPGQAPMPSPPAPPGIDPAIWEYMTPEDKALFQ